MLLTQKSAVVLAVAAAALASNGVHSFAPAAHRSSVVVLTHSKNAGLPLLPHRSPFESQRSNTLHSSTELSLKKTNYLANSCTTHSELTSKIIPRSVREQQGGD